jgi:hypothetical protein
MLRAVAASSLILMLIALAGCSSTAVPLGIPVQRHAPQSDPDKLYRGVVNGLWRYDAAENIERLQGPFGETDPQDALQLSDRYQVRVGIDRSWFLGEFSEVVVLPAGWTYSPDVVVSDGRTINIGDVVKVHLQPSRGIRSVTELVRKCDESPLPDENKDWNIGCRSAGTFNSRGYAGEKYYLTGF